MVESKLSTACTARTREVVRIDKAQPVERKERSLDARSSCTAIVAANKPARLVHASLAAKPKSLRLSTASRLGERVMADFTEGSWHLDDVAHDLRIALNQRRATNL